MAYKICIDCRELTENLTGIGRFTYNLISLFCEPEFNNYEIFLISNKNIFFPENKRIIKIIENCNNFYFEFFFVNKFIKKNNINFFISPYYKLPYISFNKCIKIITIHDLGFITFPSEFYARSNFYRLFAKKKLLNSLFNSDFIFTVSNFTKNEIIENFNFNEKKIFILNNYINDEFLNLANNMNKKIESEFILCVCNFKPHKNIKALIFAYNKYYEKIKIPLYIIGGAGIWFDKIKKIISENNFKNIFLINNIDNQQLSIFYKNAKLFVYPSLYEGFGLPPLEAMAFNCPVICSKEAALSEITGNSLFYFNPFNIDSIGKTIYYILNNDTKLKELQKKGKEESKKYNKENTKKQLLNFFKNF